MTFAVTKKIDGGESWGRIDSSTIYTYDFETRIFHEIAPFGAVCERPAFSPDDKLIAFYRAPLDVYYTTSSNSNDENGHVLCVVPAGGGEVQVLSPKPNTIYFGLPNPPSWSPEGKRILFVARYNEPGVKPPDLLPVGIYMVNIDTGKMERMTPAERGKGARCPSWAPDGKRFACIMHRKLVVVDAETCEISNLIPEKRVSRCRWVPEGDLIASTEYVSPGYFRLFVISADGKRSLVLTDDIDTLCDFCWVE